MTRKVLGCFLLFIMMLSLLNGCSSFNSLSGGACYWENKIRHNLPIKLSKSTSPSTVFTQKQLFDLNFGNKILNKTDSSVNFNGDIYIAGISDLGDNPCYWKNGAYTPMDNGGNISDIAFTNDIFIEDGIIYVVGYYQDFINYKSHACYWIDGIRHDLDGGTETTSIFVKDGVVYVAGGNAENPLDENRLPCYWVNDVKHPLDGLKAYDIYVDENNDVYVAGKYLYPETDSDRACYWKNGVRTPLIDNYYASSIVVRDSVVYVAACDSHSQTAGMVVNGSDVYVTGTYLYNMGPEYENGWGSAPGYWKNGELIPLSEDGGDAKKICVSGDDILITGQCRETPNFALWINGQPINLDICPSGLFVVPNSN